MKIFPAVEREKILKDELNRIIEVIKRYYEPEKIIVFGSLISGMVHEWSDIDILRRDIHVSAFSDVVCASHKRRS